MPRSAVEYEKDIEDEPMTAHAVTLDVPKDAFDRAQKLADISARRVEDIMLDELVAALKSPEPALSADEEAELSALRWLSDDALWTIAREKLPQETENRLAGLLSATNLNETESLEAESLVERSDRLLVRRAEAAAILTRRGHIVTADSLNEA